MRKILPLSSAKFLAATAISLAVLLSSAGCSGDGAAESESDPMAADDLIIEPFEPGTPESESADEESSESEDEASKIPVVPLESFTIDVEKAKELLADEAGIVAITTPEQLAALAVLVNSGDETYMEKSYVLQNDINLAEYDFTPIGGYDSNYEGFDFNAKFDGGDHLVKNLTIRDAGFQEGTGLFGRIGPNGTVENLHIINGRISGMHSVGGLVGRSAGVLKNCSFQGEVRSEGGVIGGLAGSISFDDSPASVSSCFVNAEVYGNSDVGVFAGEILFGASVNDSYALGSATSVKSSGTSIAERVGGFAGSNFSHEVARCYSNAEVYTNVTSSLVGAFIGFSDGAQQDCYYNHTATANWKPIGNREAAPENDDPDTEYTGILFSLDGVNACETLALCERETFTGWDFDSVWDIADNLNRGLPFLR